MINIHLAAATLFTFFGIVVIAAIPAYVVAGIFISRSIMDGPQHYFWVGLFVGAAIWAGVTLLLGHWTELWGVW